MKLQIIAVSNDRQKSFTMHRNKGFTITELLVVIAILVLLAALSVPMISNIHQKSLAASCKANLRQIGGALLNYVADHNGVFIPAAISPAYGYWYNRLEPYMGGGAPGWTGTTGPPPDWQSADRPKWQLCPAKKVTPMTFQTVGYGWNFQHFGLTTAQPKDSGNPIFSRMVEVEEPHNTIIIGDSKDAHRDPGQDFQNRYIYANNLFQIYAERHSGGGNYLFVDGHVEWMTPAQLAERAPRIFQKRKTAN